MLTEKGGFETRIMNQYLCIKVHLDAQLDLPSQINLMGRLAVSKILNLTSWPSMCCVLKKKVAQTKDTLVSL